MIDPTCLSITLYVPDAALRNLSSNGNLRALMRDRVIDLDFIPPPWWEQSYTAGLGANPTFQSVAKHFNS